jgi:hypothetical protein
LIRVHESRDFDSKRWHCVRPNYWFIQRRMPLN